MPVVCSLHVFELNIFKGFDQSLNDSSVKHEADLFQYRFYVDLLDDEF